MKNGIANGEEGGLWKMKKGIVNDEEWDCKYEEWDRRWWRKGP